MLNLIVYLIGVIGLLGSVLYVSTRLVNNKEKEIIELIESV